MIDVMRVLQISLRELRFFLSSVPGAHPKKGEAAGLQIPQIEIYKNVPIFLDKMIMKRVILSFSRNQPQKPVVAFRSEF
jgi:hypothetical protein